MLSKPYQEEVTHNDTSKIVYDLMIIHKTNGYVIVVITALREYMGISIIHLYDRIATQVYSANLKEIEINDIIWIERITPETSEEEFFKVDLSWDGKSKFFHSPQWEPCDEEIIFSIKRHSEKYAD
ncbi:MAG TPA: hypothetical protein VNK03_05790 [Gammaproteobacteria bacterium]|nr:hypothetical protein [Gammaproteobacteria bacterium]